MTAKQFLKGCYNSINPAKKSGCPYKNHPQIGPGTGANPVPEAECQFKNQFVKFVLKFVTFYLFHFRAGQQERLLLSIQGHQG